MFQIHCKDEIFFLENIDKLTNIDKYKDGKIYILDCEKYIFEYIYEYLKYDKIRHNSITYEIIEFCKEIGINEKYINNFIESCDIEYQIQNNIKSMKEIFNFYFDNGKKIDFDPLLCDKNNVSVFIFACRFSNKYKLDDYIFDIIDDEYYCYVLSMKNIRGFTPLMVSCQNSNKSSSIKVVEKLLSSKYINVNDINQDGHDALYLSVENIISGKSSCDTVKLLLNHKDIDVNKRYNILGETILMRAIYNIVDENTLETAISILNHKDTNINAITYDNMWTPLRFLCYYCNNEYQIEFLKKMIDCDNIDMNLKDKNGINILNFLIMNIENIQYPIDIIKILLTNISIEVNDYDDDGDTPLHFLCKYGFFEKKNVYFKILNILLDHKDIDVNKKNYEGKTPLHYACIYNNTCLIFQLLRRKNIDPDPYDDYKIIPSVYFCKRKDIDRTTLKNLINNSKMNIDLSVIMKIKNRRLRDEIILFIKK